MISRSILSVTRTLAQRFGICFRNARYATVAPTRRPFDMARVKSLLFVPSNPAMLMKTVEKKLAPDVLVPDLEDSVPLEAKDGARQTLTAFLPKLVDIGVPVIPRINSVGSLLFREDLKAVVSPHISGVVVGKVNSVEEVRVVSTTLNELEIERGLTPGSVKIILSLETAKGLVHAHAIASCDLHRVVGIGYGADDMRNDLQIERTVSDHASLPNEVRAEEFVHWHVRLQLVLAGRAAGLPVFDTPFVSFKDEAGLVAACRIAKRLGMRGMFAIHPAQLEVIQHEFTPSPAEVDHARRVVEVYERARREGRGAAALDGQMVDTPIVLQARNVLRRAGVHEGLAEI